MSPQLDSTTGTTPSNNVKCDTPATQTCNCCLLVRDFSTWNHVKSTEDSWNEVPKTGSKLDVVSRLFRFSPVAPPSHNVRPVTSVPSLGPQPLSFFASTEAPAASSTWTTSRWPFEAAIARGPSPQPEGSTQSYRRSCSD